MADKNVAFKNADVAAKFEATIESDIKINRTGYHGLLSDITLPVAEAMIKAKSQYIQAKVAAKPAAAPVKQ